MDVFDTVSSSEHLISVRSDFNRDSINDVSFVYFFNFITLFAMLKIASMTPLGNVIFPNFSLFSLSSVCK